MASQTHQLHFVLIPLMCQGHLLPMIDMAKLLAERGMIVTIVTTPLNAIQFNAITDRAIESGLPIRVLQLRFPSVEAGLPAGCESMDTLPSVKLFRNFFVALGMLQQPLELEFEEMQPRPSCIIADKHFAWVAHTAKKFQIPRIIFDAVSCFSLLCTHNLYISRAHEGVPGPHDRFVVPGLPHHIEFTRAQLPGQFNQGSFNIKDSRDRIREAELEAYGVVVNSFEELEAKYVSEYQKVNKVWCIGPLSLCNKEELDKAAQRGNKGSIDEKQCLIKWLDASKPGSVVYASLGSLTNVAAPQLVGLGLALEGSNCPFIWVIREGDKGKAIEKWIEEDGFEERTKGRGLLIRGWASEVLILSHPAIGAFLTHCAWCSTLEGVCAGVPMITWPLFGVQFLNEKLVVEVLKIGVRVGTEAIVHLGEEDNSGVLVKKEQIRKAVEIVMGEGKEGEERRRRAKEFGEMANRAIQEGGSSHLNVTLLIQDIMQMVKNRQSF